jgi:tRNA A-37 threonylcarbamoyl transferase component Bud32
MDADPTVAWKPGDGDDRASGARDASRRLDPMLGREFGGVRIERILGSGGMGRVYLGIDVASGERVAIKVLLRTQQDEGVRRRFEREGRLLERLRHPGIASVLRTGVVQDGDVDVPYIVMEHVDGVQNLADHVFRERLGVRETVQAFLQACDAVGHAHREGFIHRDVKPPNLLVDRHGRVKVIDFGVARAIAADPAINTVRTETGQLVGTMQYMSPEQFRADPRMVDARSDVYALGAVLYELLTGVQPHDLRGLPVHEAARAVCETDPADVRECNPRLDDRLADVVMEAVAREPSRRPQDANALAARLRAWMASGSSGMSRAAVDVHPDVADHASRGAARAPAVTRTASSAATPARASRGGWLVPVIAAVAVALAVAMATGVLDLRALAARWRGSPDAESGAASADTTGTPTTPRAPAATIAELRVVTAPAGAQVLLDGEPRGIAPAVVLLPSDGGAHRITARIDGWEDASVAWTGAAPPLVALNLAPRAGFESPLPRVVTLSVASVAPGIALRITAPESTPIGPGTWAVAVTLPRAGAGWGTSEIVLEARRADGAPATIEAGAADAAGTLRIPVTDRSAAAPVSVRVR